MKIRNLYFYSQVLRSLLHIRPIGKAIDRCRAAGDDENERAEILKAAKWWGTWLTGKFGADIRAEGLERIPDGPVLFVSNHQAYGDIFVFLAVLTEKQTGFVAKKQLGEIPLFGKWIYRIRSVFITQNDPRAAVETFKVGEDYLRRGFSLVIFPEGTRNLSDGMASFKKGSLRLALRTGVPVVPVTIRGSWHLFEEQGYVRPHAVDFYVHPPIETANLTKEEAAELSDRVEGIVRGKLDEWNSHEDFAEGAR
ncbi:MAG: 1-acyl-sn-glycerol-3-phosphate acyltransferase [Clostridiales Family XIII bacterium]|jgi:1-acyl-sn-glycerol-3-phosphate acyltransferase|nr:1-acyl-sn-glycerol-3-phosphate acyltransferase [Clostridiales Family XIII bacterium]